MKIYLAAPVVGNSIEVQDQIRNIANILYGYEDGKTHFRSKREEIELYLPSQIKIPNAWGMTMQEWGHCVFTVDVLELDRADWVVVCDFGRHNTAGTSWECGYAFGKGKKILVIRMPGVKEQSLMVTCCAANSIDYRQFETYKYCMDLTKTKLFSEKGREGENEEDVTLN
ncbi:MAG: nucleoside 2-deoxyribosyltransferase [Alphaproteobacteria bacterium]|nr:nucleoside 2-deoxyribosyltransferase [Alphaproteobacteria bacterium]